jgi:hypothetical protein
MSLHMRGLMAMFALLDPPNGGALIFEFLGSSMDLRALSVADQRVFANPTFWYQASFSNGYA